MKWMARLLNLLSQLIIAAFMLVVLVSAILSSVFSYYLPRIDEYRSDVLSIINEYSGPLVISADKISGSWAPFKPALKLEGVQIMQRGWEAPLAFSSMDAELDMIKSLATGSWYFSNLSVNRLSLALAQTPDGGWSLSAVTQDKESQPFNIQNFIDRLWGIGRLHLDQLDLVLHPAKTPPIRLPSLAFELTDHSGRHRLVASLKRNDKEITRLIVDAYGKPLTKGFRAKGYLEVDELPLADVTTFAKTFGALDRGLFYSKLWLDWAADDMTLEGQVELRDSTILLGKNKSVQKPLKLETVRTSLSVEYKNGKLQGWFPDILLENKADKLDLDGLYIAYDKNDFRAKLRTLDLSQLFSFTKELPLSEKMHGRLNQLSPSGLVTGLHVKFEPEDKENNKPWDLDYALRLVDINVNPWKGVPLIRHANGVVFGDKTDGRVEFDTQDLVLGFTQVFSAPMILDSAKGKVAWSLDKDWVHVHGTNLDVNGRYGDVVGEFHVMLPITEEIKLVEPARLSLDLGIHNSDAKYRKMFIPDKKLDKALLSWLNNSIHSAKIPQGGFIFNGPVSKPKGKHPIDEATSIQLWLDLEEGSITYQEGWPQIDNIKGEMLLDDLDVIARVDTGDTAGIDIRDALFTMKAIHYQGKRTKDSNIRVTGNAYASTEEVVNFLELPTMPATTRDLIKNWKIDGGPVSAHLDISTRLKDAAKHLNVKLASQIKTLDLSIPEENIHIKDIAGPLNFDLDTGLSSSGITAKFLGQPLTAKIQATGSPGHFGSLITFQTELSIEDINNWNHQPINMFMHGRSQFNGEVVMSGDDSFVKVSTNMEGISVDLPTPFQKSAEEERLMSMTLPLKSGRRELVFKYGKSADIRFLLDEKGMEAAQINLGVNKVGYEKGAISVGGQLTNANVEEWMNSFKKYTDAETTMNKNGEGTQTASEEPLAWHINIDKLKIRKIEAFGQTVYNSVVSMFNTNDYWQILLEHAQFDGTLRVYNDESRPMQLDVNTVDLGLLLSDEKSSGVSLTESSIRKIPDIDVNIDKLYWSGDDFGAWNFKVRSTDKAVMLKDMFGSFKSMRLTEIDKDRPAQVVWQLDGSETQIQGRLSGGNLANSLQLLGYREEITSKTFQFDFEAHWPGQPMDFKVATTKGYTAMLLKEGSFVNIDSGSASALKVLGILNLNLILKRLSLDFSDLSAKGLAYDQVKGRIDFNDGLFEIDKPLVVKSPSSQINLNGWADINNQTIDMTMGATLPLASNIPWLVALAGGLPTAAGVYVISRLLKKQVDALSSAVYSITGKLSDPTIKFEKLFDTGADRNKAPVDPSEALDDPFPYE